MPTSWPALYGQSMPTDLGQFPADQTSRTRAPEPWHAFFAHPDFLRFATSILPPERTALEVSALRRWLDLRPGQRVLDLGCGYGRIASHLSRAGIAVTGVDASPELIDQARRTAPDGVHLDYRLTDMRDLELPQGTYDAVINMSTAFGYVDDQVGEQDVLRRVSAVLRPGGLLCLDTENRDQKIRNARDTMFNMAGGTVYCRRAFDVITGRWTETMSWDTPEGTGTSTFDVRLYAYTELRDMLTTAGLEISRTYGWFDGTPLTEASPRMIIIARRPEQEPAVR